MHLDCESDTDNDELQLQTPMLTDGHVATLEQVQLPNPQTDCHRVSYS